MQINPAVIKVTHDVNAWIATYGTRACLCDHSATLPERDAKRAILPLQRHPETFPTQLRITPQMRESPRSLRKNGSGGGT